MVETSRPKNITIIIVALIVLAVLSTASLVSNRIGLLRAPNRQFQTQGGNFQGGGGTFQPGTGNFQGGGGNFQGNFGNGQNRRFITGFNLFSISRSIGISGPWLIYVSLGFSILGILLLLASAYGVWKGMRWGLNLGTVLGLVFLLGALPGLFSLGGRNFNWLRSGLNILSAAATLPILGLSLLPSVRDFFPKPKK